MTQTYGETAPRPEGRRRGLDIGLNVALVVLSVALVAFAAYFGYTVWQSRQAEDLTDSSIRVIKSLETQVKKSPNDATLRVRLGEAYGSAGRYSDAIEQLNAALKIEPEHVGAYLDLGMVAMLTNNDNKAISYFEKVIEITDTGQYTNADERRENAYYNLGTIYLDQQEYEKAIGYFKNALRITKDASDTYLSLARALRGVGDNDSAIVNIEYALAFDPGYAEAHYTLAQIYEEEGDMVNASYHYYEAARLSPDSDQPQEALAALGTSSEWVAKAQKQLEEGSIEDALTSALVARNLDPESVEAVAVHAEVLMARKSYKDALEVYLDGLDLDAENQQFKNGIKTIEKEHPKDALAGYQAALKDDSSNEDLKAAVARMKKAVK